MARVFTEKITTAQLASKILYAWSKYDQGESLKYALEEEDAKIDEISKPEEFCCKHVCWDFRNLTNRVITDLGKIDFDSENIDAGKDIDKPELLGFHTLSSGLTYIGFQSGGDWEIPIFFILYWDGVELRAYIPAKGNTFNAKTKTAIGNNEEEDQKYAESIGLKTCEEINFEVKPLILDIFNRIRYTGE